MSAPAPAAAPAPDMSAFKARLKEVWSSGDFGKIAASYETDADIFVSRLHINPNDKVLDVACGTGNLAIPAARTGAMVVGVDIAPNLLEQARERAKHANVEVAFEEGDVEQLHFPDGSFDKVITMFGAIFAPSPDVTASEMLRVTKSGGMIAMANWTTTSFIGEMFKLTEKYVPPSPLMTSPMQWGDPVKLRERFGKHISDLHFTARSVSLRFDGMSPPELVDFWREMYGPTRRAFDVLAKDVEKQNGLRDDLIALWTKHNTATGKNVLVEAEYLEVTAVRA